MRGKTILLYVIVEDCVNCMDEKGIKTKLNKKQSKFPKVCTNCDNTINPGEIYHLEAGVNEHLHSLIARQFCSECYAKYGEQSLLKGNLD